MKKLKFILKMLLFAALVAPWASCCKSDDNVPDEGKDEDPYMEVCEHVCDIGNQIATLHETCSSIAELSQHIDEIKQMENVEDVYTTNTTMFVRVKDFGVISYSYFPKREPLAAPTQARRIKMSSTRTDSDEEVDHLLLGLESAVISVWFKGIEEDCADIISKALGSCKIKTVPKEPNIDFFQYNIFDYDVVYVDTHGMWDPKEKLHWLITTEEPTADEEAIYNSTLKKDKLYKFKDIDRDQLSIGYVDEDRDGKRSSVPYFRISEKFIDNSTKDFKKKGKSICFITSCQTMMGGELTEIDHDIKNPSMAKIFEKKGAGVYLGFDESNSVGHYSAMFFFTRLASGMSIERAFNTLTDDVVHDSGSEEITLSNGKKVIRNYVADLLPDYSDGNKKMSSSCITQPVLGEMENNSTEIELNYVLKATSPLYLDALVNYSSGVEQYLKSQYFDRSQFSWGFQISDNENFSVLLNPQAQDSGSYNNNVVTDIQSLSSIDLKTNTAYYYRGFFYDGQEYYYTKTGQFTTRTFNTDGGTSVPNVPGSDF